MTYRQIMARFMRTLHRTTKPRTALRDHHRRQYHWAALFLSQHPL